MIECGVVLAVGVVLSLFSLIYIFLISNYNYWRKRGVNGPTPKPLLGTFPSLFNQKQNFALDLADIYNEYKHTDNFVGVYLIRTPQILILEPKLIKEIFVTAFKHFENNEFSKLVDKKKDPLFANNPFILNGKEWREQRALITPGLTGARIKVAYSIMQDVCDNFCDFISHEIKMAHPNGFDGKRLAIAFTAENVCDSVLGLKAKSFTQDRIPIAENVKMFEEKKIFVVYTLICGFLPNLSNIFKPQLMSNANKDFFCDLMKQAFSLRANNKVNRLDFLNYLLTIQKEHNLTEMELSSVTMSFLVDGLDTTATVISHLLLLLGRYPDVQENLLNEIMQNLDDDGKLSFEKLNELPYLDASIHESMRIFPPAAFHSKICTAPYEFTNKNGKKLQLEIGDSILIPAYPIYQDAQYFSEPEVFKPERFLPENGGIKKFKDMGLFFPFGDGPRMCLGFRFALTQVKCATVAILRRFHVKVNPRTKPGNNLDPKSFLTLKEGGVWLDFEERQQ